MRYALDQEVIVTWAGGSFRGRVVARDAQAFPARPTAGYQVSADDPLHAMTWYAEDCLESPASSVEHNDDEHEALKKRLVWIAQQKEFPNQAPRWLATLVVAFQAMDVDEPEHDAVAQLIDEVETRLGVDGEFFYDYVSGAIHHVD